MAEKIETLERPAAYVPRHVDRRRPRRWRRVALAGVLLVAAAAAGGAYARSAFNDAEVPQIPSLVGEGRAPRLLAVFAQPGDEVAAAGALAQLDAQGVGTVVVYLTRGSVQVDSPARKGTEAKQPVPNEARVSNDALGVDRVEVLDYTTTGLADEDRGAIARHLATVIAEFAPSTVLTVPHGTQTASREVHGLTGSIAAEAVKASAAGKSGGSPVSHLWEVTLPPQQMDGPLPPPLALRNYPIENDTGLPRPDAAIAVAGAADRIFAAADAYGAGRPSVSDVHPILSYLPYPPVAQVLHRILDREYFHEVAIVAPTK